MLLCLLVLLPAWLHPDSLSSTVVEIRGSQAHVVMRCQMLSLIEVLPELDADGDDVVEAVDVLRFRESIFDYIRQHYALSVGSERDLTGGRLLAPALIAVTHRDAASEEGRGYRLGAVDIEMLYEAPEPIRDLMLASTLFEATSPGHLDLVTLVWEDGRTEHVTLQARAPRFRSDPEGRGAFPAFFTLGLRHILGGWDHILFVLALVLGARNLRSVIGVITAFTVAHSATLALSALGVVDLSAHMRFVEMTIALSIAYVALDIGFFPDRVRARWIEALVFGLVHGLGFAAFLQQSLVREASRSVALVGFNVGVEAGQVPLALGFAGLLRLVRRPPEELPALVPRPLRRWGGMAIGAVGLAAFAMRL